MLKKNSLFAILFTLFGLNSCGLFEADDDKTVVARVGDNYLYNDELNDLISEEGDSTESALLKQNYIDNWVKEQLILKKALLNLSEQQADFQDQLENYKNSLLIYAYENLLVKQKLDTAISAKELKNYYYENQQNFKLKEQIIKGKLVQFLNSAPLQDSLNEWIFSDGAYFAQKLNDYCTQFTMNCHLDTSTWVPFSVIRNLLPSNYKVENLEVKKGKSVISDTTQTLIINTIYQKFPGELAPISYVSDQIKSIIRNKRKLQLLNKAREEIYEEATLKKQYEVYQ